MGTGCSRPEVGSVWLTCVSDGAGLIVGWQAFVRRLDCTSNEALYYCLAELPAW